MRIEFDPRKDEINRAKHGMSLAIAAEIDLEVALIEPDQRFPYGEAGFQAIAPIAGRLHLLAFRCGASCAGHLVAQGQSPGTEAL